MAETNTEDLLARLAGHACVGPSATSENTIAAAPQEPAPLDDDPKLDSLLNRLNNLASGDSPAPMQPTQNEPIQAVETVSSGTSLTPPSSSTPNTTIESVSDTPKPSEPAADGEFIPQEPTSFKEAGLTESEVEGLMIKYLLAQGDASGRDISSQIQLPFLLLDGMLHRLKHEQMVVHQAAAPMNDYVYRLTDQGRDRARRLAMDCTYFGSAPVPLKAYIHSVKQQSIEHQHPGVDDLAHAFDDLLINPKMMLRLGPAINSGRGLFLFGAPGNGKTSIAERVTLAFGKHVWIPRALTVDGQIIRLFDPGAHEEAPLEQSTGLLDRYKIDKRWVRILRPTIIVGGELTMSSLEVAFNPTTGISESPIQLKSNCGTLVIDDFGRQRMSTDELLNRWIVPLEKRYDFLNLANGKKIQVPFDQLIIFSTNLEPRDLCDDAFLRRIPYKIEVVDPSEDEFRQLFMIMCSIFGIEYSQEMIDYLITTHFRPKNRPFRCCHPRDILLQVKNLCLYRQQPAELTHESLDFAVDTYFSTV